MQPGGPSYNRGIPMKLPALSLRYFAPTAIVLSLFLCVLPGVHAQVLTPQQGNPANEAAWEAKQKHAAEKQQNLKREQDIKKDTQKLLDLATELKQYVDKTNEHTLSVEVIKKAEEIEKLAHGVKEKMKGQ